MLQGKEEYSQDILQKYSRDLKSVNDEQEALEKQKHMLDSYGEFLDSADKLSLLSDSIFLGLFMAEKVIKNSNSAITAFQIGFVSCLGLASGYTLLKSGFFSPRRVEQTMGDLTEFEMKLYNNHERYKGIANAYYDLSMSSNSLEKSMVKRR